MTGKPRKLTFVGAAEHVLKQAARPLNYREITRLAVEEDLLQTWSVSPDTTMNASLSGDMKRRGSESRFVRHGRGIIGLSEWQKTPSIAELITKNNQEVEQALHEKALAMPPLEFELLIG